MGSLVASIIVIKNPVLIWIMDKNNFGKSLKIIL
jgi:hypothetical protein